MYTERINLANPKQKAAVINLLSAQDLSFEQNLDYLIGLFDQGHELLAVGGAFHNTLRSIAVRPDRQTENLSGQLISALIYEQLQRGHEQLFLYTKSKNTDIFESFGFQTIVQSEHIVFMSNQKNIFADYLTELKEETLNCLSHSKVESSLLCEQNPIYEFENLTPMNHKTAAIVLNANPVTKGHLFLIEKAASEMDFLHLFLLSAEASEFPFALRKQLLEQSIAHIPNICLHETKDFLVSQAIFPAYFIPDKAQLAREQAEIDALIFLKIAEKLNIEYRYVGEEPYSEMTSIYHQTMQKKFSQSQVKLRILPRWQALGDIISASKVRIILQEYDYPEIPEKITHLVPDPVLQFIKTEKGRVFIQQFKTGSRQKNFIY